MSGIKNDQTVQNHFSRYPDERNLILPFTRISTLTWADRRRAMNADLSVFILRADDELADNFGFTQEILAVYSPHRELQARAFQGADELLSELPMRGRVDPLTCIIISNDPDADGRTVDHLARNRESRMYVGFSASELSGDRDGWVVRNRLMRRLFGRDLFDHRLPLRNDTYFFGRESLVQEFQQAFLQGENRGLFGLRKTGKTSMLYKLQRLAVGHASLRYLHYDCKSPAVRMLTWTKLLRKIGGDLASLGGLSPMDGSTDGPQIADDFVRIVHGLPPELVPVLIFDEIEYVSPFAKLDAHWKDEFIPFWQTIWSAQSMRPMPVLVCGVSPAVVETDLIGHVQNPLFGIVPPRYLTGLDYDEVCRMLVSLGGRIGLKFSGEAARYVFQRYGGHPFLSRLACSFVHRLLQTEEVARPVQMDAAKLLSGENTRDGELAFYCGHVVSELKEFYPDEYTLLEVIATGQTADYLDYYRQPEFIMHLTSYGLVQRGLHGKASISIPVVGHYVGLESARAEGRKTILKVIPREDRTAWLDRRVRAVADDIRTLEGLTRRPGGTLLFGANSFPEADKLLQVRVCDDESGFSVFINVLNRCLVESIEKHGASVSRKHYFWEQVKLAYPVMWDALCRIKVYRHHRVHLVLNESMDEILRQYLRRDLEGQTPSGVSDLWFTLQQCVLDGLFLGVQAEIERLQ